MQNTKRTVVVNLTSMQNTIAKFLQRFLDPSVVEKQVFCQQSDPEQFDEFIFKSQRPTEYGGTAPTVTRYWPPIMPPLDPKTDIYDEKKLNMVKKQDYPEFLKSNPQLVPMPKRLTR